MFHLLKAPLDRYRFYDDDTCTLSLIPYLHIPEAYSAFTKVSTQIEHTPPHIAILATSPDYDSFYELYPEFFI